MCTPSNNASLDLPVSRNPAVSVAVWPLEVAKTSLRPKNLRRQYPKKQARYKAMVTIKH